MEHACQYSKRLSEEPVKVRYIMDCHLLNSCIPTFYLQHNVMEHYCNLAAEVSPNIDRKTDMQKHHAGTRSGVSAISVHGNTM